MASTIEDPKIAMALRDTVTRLVVKTLDAERPPARYGTVQSIDRNARTALVRFPGMTTDTKVRMGAIQPSSTGVVVRVEGTVGDRYIADVVGAALLTDVASTALTAPTLAVPTSSSGNISLDWTEVQGATSYEITLADNSTFTTNVKTYSVAAPTTVLTVPNQTPDSTRHARVRARNSGGNGPWSATQSKVIVGTAPVESVTEPQPLSDGAVPTSSPAANVVGAQNALDVHWTAISNADPVTYEVYISTTNNFTPVDGGVGNNKVGEVSGTAFRITRLPDGSALVENAGYYVKLWAKDRDGKATSAGTQGFGNVTRATDGTPPSGSPQPTVSPGLSFLLATWPAATGTTDQVTYEIHLGTTSGFLVSATTKVGETTLTSFIIARTPAGGNLEHCDYFVRLVAKDADGAAAPGPQSSPASKLLKVELGDVGNVPSSAISDKVAPATSPNTPDMSSGVGFLLARWGHVSNPDSLIYEVHLSDVSGFTPDANTKITETPATHAFIRTQGPGKLGAPLQHGVTYYVRIWAKDQDGFAPAAGTQSSAFIIKANTADIAVGAITAASAIIADATIDTAQMVNLAVTTAKISDLAVNTAKIANLAVTEAKIDNLAVTNAKIANATIESAKIRTVKADSIETSTLTSAVVSLSTGGVFRAGAVAASTQRLEITAAGLKVISRNASNVDSVLIDLPVSGSATFSGNINGSNFVVSGTKVNMNMGPNYFTGEQPAIMWTNKANGVNFQIYGTDTQLNVIVPTAGSPGAGLQLTMFAAGNGTFSVSQGLVQRLGVGTNGGVYIGQDGIGPYLTGPSGRVQINTPSNGWMGLGPANTSHAHFDTDRGGFWFTKSVFVNGQFASGGTGSRMVWHHNTTGTAYTTSPVEIRNDSNGNFISFHWGGVVASSIGLESDGYITFRNNPGTSYEGIKCGTMRSGDIRSRNHWLTFGTDHGGISLGNDGTLINQRYFMFSRGSTYKNTEYLNMYARDYHSNGVYIGSDSTFKTNVADATIDALAIVRSVKTKTYKRKGPDGLPEPDTELGFLADDFASYGLRITSERTAERFYNADGTVQTAGPLGLGTMQVAALIWKALQKVDTQLQEVRTILALSAA